MATAVRDEIARSPRYTLVGDIPESEANSFVVDTIAVVDDREGDQPTSLAIATSVTYIDGWLRQRSRIASIVKE